jgi:cobalt-zinc-cadmium efflux system membrane fusion protein
MSATPVKTDPCAFPPTPECQAPAPAPTAEEGKKPRWFFKALKSAVAVLVLVCVLGLFAAFVLGLPVPGLAATHKEQTVRQDPPLGVHLVKGKPNTLRVPADVRRTLGIRKGKTDRFALARVPTEGRPLELPGSTALDPTRLVRVRIRFAPAEVVQIGQMADSVLSARAGKTVFRELRSGDLVRKGDLLATVYSVDVGSKKNDLIDALVQLKLDQQILDRAEKSAHAVPEVFLLNARRNVEADRNAMARALNTLKTWRIPEEDIQAVYDEAEKISKRRGKRDTSKTEQWARVELRAQESGTIVERNVALHEVVVDNTVNLFQIARVDRLTVVANAPEDDLPTLLNLQTDERVWNVRTVNTPAGGGIKGTIDEISYLIDVNQHNAVVKGHIDNPGGKLRAGQFITATINLPPPEGVVAVPVSAVVDDGRQCVVFVQPDPKKQEYTLRRVEVKHRFEKVLYVRSLPFARGEDITEEEKEQGLLPRRPLLPGERVLTTGVLELKKELEDRQSQGGK